MGDGGMDVFEVRIVRSVGGRAPLPMGKDWREFFPNSVPVHRARCSNLAPTDSA